MLRSRFEWVVSLAVVLVVPAVSWAKVLKVPEEHATIQSAIDAAQSGDSIAVGPGTYVENLDFAGKDLKLESTQGPELTIVDGGGRASVVRFARGETSAALLKGFTLRGGLADFEGGGINIDGASPTVEGNLIIDNGACEGGGIAIVFASPVIRGNVISSNRQSGCSGGSGGGIYIGGAGRAEILDNVIENNSIGSGDGGGIALFAAGKPVIVGNVISGNKASGISPCSEGGGIQMVNASDALIANNQISGNSAGCGGGVAWLVPSGQRGPLLVNNTIVDNTADQGSGVYADGFDGEARLVNNIIVARAGESAIFCGDFNDTTSPLFENNNVFSAGAPAYAGACADATGLDGNISADPRLSVCAARGLLVQAADSPGIDVGQNGVAGVGETDLAGGPRVHDGDGDGTPVIDQGAVEYPGLAMAVSSKAEDFGAQRVGQASPPRSLWVTNQGCEAVTLSRVNISGDFSVTHDCERTLSPGTRCELSIRFEPQSAGERTGQLEIHADAPGSPFLVSLRGTGEAESAPSGETPPPTSPDQPVVPEDSASGCGCRAVGSNALLAALLGLACLRRRRRSAAVT